MKKIITAVLALSFLSVSSLSFAAGECTLYHKHHKRHGQVKHKTVSQQDVLNQVFQHKNRTARGEFEPRINQTEPNFEAFTDTYQKPAPQKKFFHKHHKKHRFHHINRCQ